MSHELLTLIVVLASFEALSIAASVAARYVSPARQTSARAEARALFGRAVLPTAVPLAVAFGLVLVAFVAYEPRRDDETTGVVLPALALAGTWRLAQLVAGFVWMLHAARRVVRGWRASATPLPREPWGVPASRIDVGFPVVAVTGFFRPHVFVDRRVLDGCSAAELAAVAAHERAHVSAADNLRRLVVGACAGASSEVAAAWRVAAERAADERAVETPRMATDLAAALVRVARGASVPALPTAISTIHDGGCLESRVRRLLELDGHAHGRKPRSMVLIGAVSTGAAVALTNPSLKAIHAAVELLVQTLP